MSLSNWDNLTITGVIRPTAIETDSLKVGGQSVQTEIPVMAYIADATDGTDVITQLNALLAALQAAGLMDGPPTP